MGELSKLPNIGATVEKQLNDIGIHTYEFIGDYFYNCFTMIFSRI